MKKLIYLILFIVASPTSAQTIIKTKRSSRVSLHVRGNDFEGVIFNDKYDGANYDNTTWKVFTPTIEEIENAERLMRVNLDTVHDYLFHEPGKRLNDHLPYYVRQFFGFVNQKGEKIIWINCFYKYNNIYRDKKYWLKKRVFVYDGGMTFWNIKVNLSNSNLFDLWINGI